MPGKNQPLPFGRVLHKQFEVKSAQTKLPDGTRYSLHADILMPQAFQMHMSSMPSGPLARLQKANAVASGGTAVSSLCLHLKPARMRLAQCCPLLDKQGPAHAR